MTSAPHKSMRSPMRKKTLVAKKKDSLMSAIKETKSAPVQTVMSIQKIEETRGRKPLGEDKLRFKIRDELTRQFIKIEKEAYKFFPDSNADVQMHVYNAIRRAIS